MKILEQKLMDHQQKEIEEPLVKRRKKRWPALFSVHKVKDVYPHGPLNF